MTPWLSIVIPSRNGERWLGETLRSVAQEPASDGIECVLVDGSDDEATVRVAETSAARLPIRIFRRPDLSSWQAKASLGVNLASATHFCVLPVDDLWLPGRAAAARHWIETAPEAALHLNPSRIVDETGRGLGLWRCPLPPDRDLATQEVLERLIVQNFIAVPAPIMRRDLFLASGGLDETLWYTADWDLYLRLAAMGPVRYHPEVLTAFRIHGKSLTVTGSRSSDDFEAQMRIVLDRHRARLTGPGREAALRRAETSIAMNVALAAALHGERGRLSRAVRSLLGLGLPGMAHYFRDSRLHERLLPRLRARLSGPTATG